MNSSLKAALVGGVAGGLLVVVALTAALWLMGVQPIRAQSFQGQDPMSPPQALVTPTPSPSITHDQMHKMMDATHGAGTSERMHEAMGADAEKLMDQCVGMINMMGSMMGMMQGGQGMMGGGMQGMMGGR